MSEEAPKLIKLKTGSFYRHFFGPILANDQGLDAEYLSSLAISALGHLSICRNWPGVSGILSGLANEIPSLLTSINDQ